MEQAATETQRASTVLNYFDAERDPQRRKSMSRMRVENRNTKHLPLPSGNLVEPGVSEILVYEDEVPAVKAQVELGDDKFRLAKQAYMTAVALEVKSMIDWAGSIEDLQKVIENKSDKRANEAYELLARESHLSFEGKFTEIFGRGPLPLVSAEVVATGIPEPQRVGMEEEKKRFVDVLKEAGIGSNAPSAEALTRLITEQVAAGVAAELRRHGIISSQIEPKPVRADESKQAQPPRK